MHLDGMMIDVTGRASEIDRPMASAPQWITLGRDANLQCPCLLLRSRNLSHMISQSWTDVAAPRVPGDPSRGAFGADLRIPESELAWKSKSGYFAERHLSPHEVELGLIGHLPAETLTRLRDAVVEYSLSAINHGKEHGGQGLTQLQQVLVNEEVGKATGAL